MFDIASLPGYLPALILPILSAWASVHILETKEDVRAALGWIAVVWLVPVAGLVGYYILGINRVRRQAATQRREALGGESPADRSAGGPPLEAVDPDAPPRFCSHSRLAAHMTHMELSPANRIDALINGDEAYPAMIAAIDGAQRSVALSSYIYDWDRWGRSFADALMRAVGRGVAVRVLVDAVGGAFIAGRLRRRGVPARAFNPLSPLNLSIFNLRTHRKLLVVDGRHGFTGGMNISDRHCAGGRAPLQAQDIMFALDGPAARQLVEVFAEDWRFAGGEKLEGAAWYPDMPDWAHAKGPAVTRAVPDSPAHTWSTAAWILESALSVARQHVRITTPYFLPDVTLAGALSQAALRGVEVDILIPERNNHRVVGWATQALLPPLLRHGCRVWLTPPPLDHAKLAVVDDYWTLLGSSNWDARSFRLNFELNLEVYDHAFAARAAALLDQRRQAARPMSRAMLDDRPTSARLRDRACWLMSPYL